MKVDILKKDYLQYSGNGNADFVLFAGFRRVLGSILHVFICSKYHYKLRKCTIMKQLNMATTKKEWSVLERNFFRESLSDVIITISNMVYRRF